MATRFFEFKEPYSALIKARDKEQAILLYQRFVADIERDHFNEFMETVSEISLSEAISQLKLSFGEDGKTISDSEIIRQLEDDEITILTVEVSLC